MTNVASNVLIVPMNYGGDIVFLHDDTPEASTLILPDGTVADNETPEAAAGRVLNVHTGYRAEVTFALGALTVNSEDTPRVIYPFLVRNLVPAQPMGADVFNIKTLRAPFDDLETLIATQQLRDATLIAALFLARSFVTGQYQPDT